MDSILDALWDFIKVRQLNFAVAATLTLGYLIYQYWGVFFQKQDLDDDSMHSVHGMTRSGSRPRHVLYKGKRTLRHGYRHEIHFVGTLNTMGGQYLGDYMLLSRSKSRTRSYHSGSYTRSGRRYGRCPDCTKCNNCAEVVGFTK